MSADDTEFVPVRTADDVTAERLARAALYAEQQVNAGEKIDAWDLIDWCERGTYPPEDWGSDMDSPAVVKALKHARAVAREMRAAG